MLTAIGKFSKSFFVKLLVGIIILPFVFWGMGDVFRGGNQNVIATVESEKISTQEFLDHLRRFNLNEKQIKDLPKSDLIEKILSEYIGKKVMALEIQELGIFCTFCVQLFCFFVVLIIPMSPKNKRHSDFIIFFLSE